VERFWGGHFDWNLKINGCRIFQECQKGRNVFLIFLWFAKIQLQFEALALTPSLRPQPFLFLGRIKPQSFVERKKAYTNDLCHHKLKK
jgi:hypothetical protein